MRPSFIHNIFIYERYIVKTNNCLERRCRLQQAVCGALEKWHQILSWSSKSHHLHLTKFFHRRIEQGNSNHSFPCCSTSYRIPVLRKKMNRNNHMVRRFGNGAKASVANVQAVESIIQHVGCSFAPKSDPFRELSREIEVSKIIFLRMKQFVARSELNLT